MKPKKIKKANSFVFKLLAFFIMPFIKRKYGFSFDKKTSWHIKRPCLILSNHQTGPDQFTVASGFNFGINIIASDSLFRHGFLSWVMRFLARPIPISKGSSDMSTVRHIVGVIKDGGAVMMFPSGNRSFFGDECRISPTVGRLAKKLGVPLVLVNQHGGYSMKPRWKAKPNKGKMTATVTRVLQPEELDALSADQVNEIILQELSFNEIEYQRRVQGVYKGRQKAEYLESVLFYCPQCKRMDGLRSQGNDFFCECGMRVRFNDINFFDRVSNAQNIPDNILGWSREQLEYIKDFDYSGFSNTPVFSDKNVRLSKTVKSKKDEFLGEGSMSLYNDRIEICGRAFPVAEITDIALQGVKRFLLYTKEGAFVADVPPRTNLMKYMVCGYRLKNAALNIEEDYYGY